MDQPEPAASLVVTVVRTGGVSGVPRRWRVEPSAADTDRWTRLVDDCPWDEPCPPARGADRFVWRLRAERAATAAREADIPDAALSGPWRALVEAVRAATRPR